MSVKLDLQYLVGVRVRITCNDDLGHHSRQLDPGNGVGTIMKVDEMDETIVFVAIDKPGKLWNRTEEELANWRGWWYRLDYLTLLNEEQP